MTHRYDWSKLDAGWEERGGELRWYGDACRGSVYPFLVSVMEKQSSDYVPDRSVVDSRWCDLYPEARVQLAKCRIRDTEPAPPHDKFPAPTGDNTALFEAMDKMAAKAGAEDVSQYVCQACGKHGLHLCEIPEPPGTKWFYPSQPWRRGHLAAWTLVNISCHDGRLTVVMKRGRGELVDETGPDDESLWERLSAKVVEFDKAKAKAAAEAK